jgi:hypothetical protein
MAFLDKLMFWKKAEEPIPDMFSGLKEDKEELPPYEPAFEEPMGMEHIKPGMPERPAMQLNRPMQQKDIGMDRDVELILAKLDAIKARMESVDARLANIEKLAEE